MPLWQKKALVKIGSSGRRDGGLANLAVGKNTLETFEIDRDEEELKHQRRDMYRSYKETDAALRAPEAWLQPRVL